VLGKVGDRIHVLFSGYAWSLRKPRRPFVEHPFPCRTLTSTLHLVS
jgi:hypothetical protein